MALSVCRLFATYRPHAFPGDALRDRIDVDTRATVRAQVNVRNESGRGAETAYAVCTALQHAEGRRDVRRYFREQFTFRVTKGRSDDAGEHQSGETPTAYGYGCPALQRNGGAVAARNLAAHCSQETAVQAGTRRARNEESEPPFRRDSRNCWQPEEKEMSVSTRR